MTFPFGQYVHSAVTNAADNEYDTITIAVGQIDRIGIQAIPSAAFKINEELFHIGRTGLFEAEVPVSSLKVQRNKDFIIDYHYIGG